MAYNPLDAFSVGQKIGKAKRSTFGTTSDDIKENYDMNQKNLSELGPAVTTTLLKEGLERNRPLNPLQEAQRKLAEAKAAESSGSAGRDIFLVNRRTGTISKAGDKTMAPVDPSLVGQRDRIMGVDIPPAGTASMFTAAEASTKQIDDLIQSLSQPAGPNSPNKFIGGLNGLARPVQGLANKATQDYGLIRQDFSDRLLRLRSGAQINEQEFKRLMGMLPQWWRNTETDIQQLNKFKTEYQNLMTRLSGEGGYSGGMESRDSNLQPQAEEDPAGIFE